MAQAVALLEKDLAPNGRGAWFEAFKFYDLEDQPLSYREIADRLHVSESDVRNYLHRVRTRLREILADRRASTSDRPRTSWRRCGTF